MPIKGTYYSQTLGAAPTTSSHLGGTLNSTIITTTTGSGTPISYNSITLTPGSWILFGNITFPGVNSYALATIGGTLNVNELNFQQQASFGTGQTYSFALSRGVNITSNATFYLSGQTGSSVTAQYVQFYAYRIG